MLLSDCPGIFKEKNAELVISPHLRVTHTQIHYLCSWENMLVYKKNIAFLGSHFNKKTKIIS